MPMSYIRGSLKFSNVTVLKVAGAHTIKNAAGVVKKFAGTLALTLPIPPASGFRTVFVKDGQGDSGAQNITIAPDGVKATTIDGAATLVLSTNYGHVLLLWNGTEWGVIA